jgi:hypothetical protein
MWEVSPVLVWIRAEGLRVQGVLRRTDRTFPNARQAELLRGLMNMADAEAEKRDANLQKPLVVEGLLDAVERGARGLKLSGYLPRVNWQFFQSRSIARMVRRVGVPQINQFFGEYFSFDVLRAGKIEMLQIGHQAILTYFDNLKCAYET